MSTAHGHHLSRAPCVLNAALRLRLGLSEMDCRVVVVAELSVSSSISAVISLAWVTWDLLAE